MKKQKLMRALSLADDKYIEEASPIRGSEKKQGRVRRPRVWLTLAACFCCGIIAFNLWLFIPFNTSPPDVSMYSDSEYYDVIVKLNEITYAKPRYKNNFQKYFGGIFKGAKAEDALEMGVADGSATGTPRYEEVTDNQVSGVIEGDLIKRSNQNIFYLDCGELRVYSIDKENTREVGSFTVTGAIEDARHFYSYQNSQIYLSEDCRTVTAILEYSAEGSSQPSVALVSLDVSDPTDISVKRTVRLTGSFISSRIADNSLLLISDFKVSRNPDFSDESQFLPSIDSGEGFESVPMDGILSPDALNVAAYTLVSRLDPVALTLEDTAAFLSYSDTVYVSRDTLYVTRSYDCSEYLNDNYNVGTAKSDISAMKYTEENFSFVGTVTVNGSVKDQYSMDEKDGILRVVTTTERFLTENKKRESRGEEILMDTVSSTRGDTSADLYCIDFGTGEIVGSLVGFAPKGESVTSVRFDGDTAYVCTAVIVKVTDPVFFIDLSDMNNITYKDTGTISGFSTSLVDFTDGYLLGIGVGDVGGNLKVEIYGETATGVESVCAYNAKYSEYSRDYKAYFIDRENGLVGLGVRYYGDLNGYQSADRYVLLHFDGNRLTEVFNVPLNGYNDAKRAVLIDGYMYLLGSNRIDVQNISELVDFK